MMKLIVLAVVVAISYGVDVDGSFAFKCVSGKDTPVANCTSTGTGADKDAADAAAKAAAHCHGPDNAVVDNTYTEYGCGACPTNATLAKGCKACAGTTNSCNAYAPPIVSFKCYKGGNKTACPAAAKIECFWPSKTYAGNEAGLVEGGCGNCAAAKAAQADSKWNATTDCATCTTALCNNGAHTVIPFLAPLIAVLFWL